MKHPLVGACSLLLLPLTGLSQGPVNPPGAPAPTMKTLDQVEARIPIDAVHTPGDEASEFIIPANASGSYYLTGNINVSKVNGIRVAAGNVTIDLNGFVVQRTANAGGTGVRIEVNAPACEVKNGTIRGFETGLRARSEDPFSNGALAGRVRHVTVTNCSGGGIWVGDGWEIEGCVAHQNGFGIAAHNGVIKHSVANSSTVGPGISLNSGTVLGCTAKDNKSDGINVTVSGTMSDCVTESNGGNGIRNSSRTTISKCTAAFNGANGMLLGSSAVVSGCTVFGNDDDGIEAGDDCELLNNASSSNGRGNGITTGAGIRVTGKANRIRGNNTTANDIGISAGGVGNLIEDNHVRNHTGPGIQVTTANGKNVVIRNIAGDNVNSYSAIASGNDVGPITGAAAVTSPSGNIQN